MKNKTYILFIIILACTTFCSAQKTKGKAKSWKWQISSEGYLDNIVFINGNKNDTIPFFHGDKAKGPAFYINNGDKDIVGKWTPKEFGFFQSIINKVTCRIHYQRWKGMPALEITLKNNGKNDFKPVKAGIKLGIDTYMDKYPNWLGKYFPTLMRNELTHFFGYLQTPSGKTLAIVSPQPVASWSIDYNLGYQDPAPHWFMGHRLESLNIDLMNTLPLPEHNPQDLTMLRPGESKRWVVAFIPVDKPELFEVTVHQAASIPMIRINQTSFNPGETASFDVIAKKPAVNVFDDEGNELNTTIKRIAKDIFRVKCNLPKVGLYKIIVNTGKYQSEGMLTAHASYQWTMEQARKAALKYHQKATSHAESWYGFYSAFIAAKYFPDEEIDKSLSTRFDYLYNKLHDSIPPKPLYYASRIQNTSTTIGMLVDKYKAEKHIKDLTTASLLGDWLMNTWQRKSDGAYINHGTVYTSVIYVAKSMLELSLAEQQAANYDIAWLDAAQRHYQSAKRAVDQLVASQGNFQTEGELTFEDGMISCSALQIGMLALMQTNKEDRQHYTEAMLNILDSHDCLAQLRVPDARRRGGTMRYWEAQYDVQMLPNMFNSPHGWSGWRAYATYYAYLLTGNEKWLLQTYNAIGAFTNMIDYKTGDLRWAFVVDPYLKVRQACSADTRYTADSLSFGNPHPDLYKTKSFVIGEQYVNMISDWQTINVQDNDIHELFKCLGETMLTNAFIVEHPNGDIVGYNCKVKKVGNNVYVEPTEKQITRLHCNMKNNLTVFFNKRSRQLSDNYLGWAFGADNYLFKTK